MLFAPFYNPPKPSTSTVSVCYDIVDLMINSVAYD